MILKDCPTRWLSLLKCVDHYLRQYEGLKSFFLSCEEAETAKICSILSRLENPLTKPLLHFISFILPSMDQFNCLFQKSTENTTSQLYDAMNRLVRLYASKFLSDGTILAASDNLKNLDFDEANHVSNEHLGIGDDTWASVSQLEHLHDTTPFFKAIRSFYVSSTKKMLVKFPFGDSLVKDLRIIQLEHTSSFSFNTITSLAKCFPPIGLNDAVSLQNLKEQFQDFKLSPNDLPMLAKYKAADIVMRPKAGLFWLEVGKMTTFEVHPRFNLLHKLMSGLMSIPVSNADSERGFSILRKIHTDQRSNLDQSTIVALITIKFNIDNCCLDIELPPELLRECKKATKSYVAPHSDSDVSAGPSSSATSIS